MHEMSERSMGNRTSFAEKCRRLNTAHQRAVQEGRRKRRDKRKTGQSCQQKKREAVQGARICEEEKKKQNEKRETSGILERSSRHKNGEMRVGVSKYTVGGKIKIKKHEPGQICKEENYIKRVRVCKRERRLACGLCLERALFWNAREDTTYAMLDRNQ